jgi:hypothetical protein
MRKDSLIPSLLGIPPIQISREPLLVNNPLQCGCRCLARLLGGFSPKLLELRWKDGRATKRGGSPPTSPSCRSCCGASAQRGLIGFSDLACSAVHFVVGGVPQTLLSAFQPTQLPSGPL